MRWKQLTTADTFSRLLQDSFHFPVIIFKHSTRCATSSVALSRIERDRKDAHGEIEFYYLDVIQYRELSRSIAEQLEVPHQSPQMLLIKDGKCLYHSSHLFISLDEAARTLAKAA
ncbi:MAG: bacillithiol system redox-active protein YtxJ [Chitinophagales bacterium]|nr:bacillithiol system redox-active protein YtxJ [Chitinophagales bacterium]